MLKAQKILRQLALLLFLQLPDYRLSPSGVPAPELGATNGKFESGLVCKSVLLWGALIPPDRNVNPEAQT